MKRHLILIPIIHTQADMGSLKEGVKREYVRKIGAENWKKHVEAIEGMWTEIERIVMALGTDFSQVKLYQDGLPVCGSERQIVEDLAKRGSRNHVILEQLIERGGSIVGTEDPQLLLEEYRIIQEALENTGLAPEEEETAGLLRRRDQYIASRIDETLEGGETGILFIGLLHRVEKYLPDCIEVRSMIARLPIAGARGGI